MSSVIHSSLIYGVIKVQYFIFIFKRFITRTINIYNSKVMNSKGIKNQVKNKSFWWLSTRPARWQYMAGSGQVSPGGCVCSESASNRGEEKGVQELYTGASLVVQWLRIRLPMQGTQVLALVWEDPTCRGATGPVSHNYWACASGACAPQQERPW